MTTKTATKSACRVAQTNSGPAKVPSREQARFPSEVSDWLNDTISSTNTADGAPDSLSDAERSIIDAVFAPREPAPRRVQHVDVLCSNLLEAERISALITLAYAHPLPEESIDHTAAPVFYMEPGQGVSSKTLDMVRNWVAADANAKGMNKWFLDSDSGRDVSICVNNTGRKRKTCELVRVADAKKRITPRRVNNKVQTYVFHDADNLDRKIVDGYADTLANSNVMMARFFQPVTMVTISSPPLLGEDVWMMRYAGREDGVLIISSELKPREGSER